LIAARSMISPPRLATFAAYLSIRLSALPKIFAVIESDHPSRASYYRHEMYKREYKLLESGS
jgi:hypothetical protein